MQPKISLSEARLPMNVFLIECYPAMMISCGKLNACSHHLWVTFVTNFFLVGLGLAGATPISQHGGDLDQGRRSPPPPVDDSTVPGFPQWQ